MTRMLCHRSFPKLAAVLLVCSLSSVGLSAQSSSSKSKTSSKTGSVDSSAKVDLNTASEKDLDGLPGVGPATAKKIIAGRPYSSVGDLSKAGISSSTIRKITPLVSAGGTEAGNPTPPGASFQPASPANQPAPTPRAPVSTAPPPSSGGAAGAGMVWVNLDSRVYHYQGSRYYGKTKDGKYMSESDAVKAGYHAAKNEKKPQ